MHEEPGIRKRKKMSTNQYIDKSRDTRKPVFGVSDQV